MDDLVYLAMAGAKQAALSLASTNNNLANASTTGFRADLDAFISLPVSGPGLESRVYVSDERAGVDLSPGVVVTTGRDLDVAINGSGYIAVQAPDGGEAYTRAGDLRVSAEGLVSNGVGQPVMGNGGPIALPPFERIEIGADGTISVQPLGQGASTLAVIDRIKLVNPPPTSLEKGADGLLRLTGGAEAQAEASVRLESGALESSNVNVVEALVTMIERARMFEVNVKMMKVAAENDAASSQLLSLS